MDAHDGSTLSILRQALGRLHRIRMRRDRRTRSGLFLYVILILQDTFHPKGFLAVDHQVDYAS
jgi:hypothetical protein